MSTQARGWVFTLNNPTAALELPEGARYLVYQKEVGESGTPHFQGYVEFARPKRLGGLKAWLPTAHFEVRRGTREQARDYARKEASRVEGPWEFGDWGAGSAGARNDLAAARDLLMKGGTKRDLLEEMPEILAKYPRFVDTVQKIAMEDRAEKILDLVPKFSWQKCVLEMVASTPNSRQILWIFDPFGNKGKTYLAKHLVDKYGAFYCNGGKTVDLCYAYNGEPVSVFDYVRDAKEYVQYGVIEQFKNGILFSHKYESGCKRFSVPHVIVFANFRPESGKFSDDRLVLVEILEDGDYKLHE